MSNTTLSSTQEQRLELIHVVNQSFRKASEHFGKEFVLPTVDFNTRGRVAGWAHQHKNHISFNDGLFVRNYVDFLKTTGPHEAAHLITGAQYPHNWRNGKRESHGHYWKQVMIKVLGADGASRCHSYDTSETRIERPHYKFACSGCDNIFRQSPRTYQNTLEGRRYCRKCRARSNTWTLIAMPAAPKSTLWTPKGTGATKMDLCWELFQLHPSRTRKYMIQVFVNQAGCTEKGASTYYYNCQQLAKKQLTSVR